VRTWTDYCMGPPQSSDRLVVRPRWLRRLRHRAAFHASRSTLVTLVTPIGNRHTRREQLRPPTAASTRAQVAKRAGPSLVIPLYSPIPSPQVCRGSPVV
jgi:hypothetical protein